MEHSAAGKLLADQLSGAAHIEINARHGMLHDIQGVTDERRRIAPDELAEDRFARGILIDGAHHEGIRAFQVRIRAEILRDEIVRESAQSRRDTKEGQISHILHRGKGEEHGVLHTGERENKQDSSTREGTGEATTNLTTEPKP